MISAPDKPRPPVEQGTKQATILQQPPQVDHQNLRTQIGQMGIEHANTIPPEEQVFKIKGVGADFGDVVGNAAHELTEKVTGKGPNSDTGIIARNGPYHWLVEKVRAAKVKKGGE